MLSLPFDLIGILAGLRAGVDLSVAAADQVHELLRRRDIAAEFAALLRHRATKAHRIRRAFVWRAGFAGRRCTANIVVAIRHDGHPLLRKSQNARARAKLRGTWTESAGARSRFIPTSAAAEAVLIDGTERQANWEAQVQPSA